MYAQVLGYMSLGNEVYVVYNAYIWDRGHIKDKVTGQVQVGIG